jgi:hypothetical protein
MLGLPELGRRGVVHRLGHTRQRRVETTRQAIGRQSDVGDIWIAVPASRPWLKLHKTHQFQDRPNFPARSFVHSRRRSGLEHTASGGFDGHYSLFKRLAVNQIIRFGVIVR